jgi:major type 1 subunit fimbrin (pilin)
VQEREEMSEGRNGMGMRMRGWLKWGVVAIFVVLAQPAWALRCLADGGSTKLIEPIGNVALYPQDAPDGYVIWVSPLRTTTGYCYKDVRTMLTNPEHVYFYANPERKNLGGLEVGIRFGKQDHFGLGPVIGSGIQTEGKKVECDLRGTGITDSTPEAVRFCKTKLVPISISYQVVVRKKGSWQPQPPSYAAFQFDGERALNADGENFRYILSGLDRLKPTPCMVDVTVTPDPGVVRFDRIQSTGRGFSPTVPRKPFQLLLKKQCNIPIRVDGYFETTHTVTDGLLVPTADSNFGIGIEDKSGNAIPFNQQFKIIEMEKDKLSESIAFNAVLKAFGPPKTGRFNGVATIRLFLY